MAIFVAEEIFGVTVAFPEGMNIEEVTGYVLHCKEKYGEKNLVGMEIRVAGDEVSLRSKLADRPIDMMKRPKMYLKG